MRDHYSQIQIPQQSTAILLFCHCHFFIHLYVAKSIFSYFLYKNYVHAKIKPFHVQMFFSHKCLNSIAINLMIKYGHSNCTSVYQTLYVNRGSLEMISGLLETPK